MRAFLLVLALLGFCFGQNCQRLVMHERQALVLRVRHDVAGLWLIVARLLIWLLLSHAATSNSLASLRR